MRAVVVLWSLVLAIAAGAKATPSQGTLAGLVTRGPITPVCTVEQPCEEPAPHVTLLFARGNALIARAVTNSAGRYRIRLPVGSYSVRRASVVGPLDRRLEPDHARVSAGHVTHLDFSIDTGIR